MASNHRGLPGGSSAYEKVLAEINATPVVEISYSEDVQDGPKRTRRGSHQEEGKMVHGLHHCYKVEGGQCHTDFRCNHDHHRVSNGHLEDITHVQGTSPTPRRRLSIAASGGSLLAAPDDNYFRGRSNSDAGSRRASIAICPSQQRRGSVTSKGSPGQSPNKLSPSASPRTQRRGSNVALHADELHYVYDQYLSK